MKLLRVILEDYCDPKGRKFIVASALSLTLCFATLVLWVRSNAVAFGFNWIRAVKDSSGVGRGVEWYVGCTHGLVYIERYTSPFALPADRLGFRYVPQQQRYLNNNWFYYEESSHRLEIAFPLPVLVALALALPLGGVYMHLHKLSKSRAEHRHCRSCGYNLTGNTSGVCPECGTTVTASPNFE
jgi:hypothetical protein